MMRGGGGGRRWREGWGFAFFLQKPEVKNAKYITFMALKPFHLVVSKYALTAYP
jgi:hypothetical protein